MTNKEKAQALWAVVMDRLRSNPEHRAALDELQALKKAAKTSLDKLGVPQVMWDREDRTNRENAKLIEDLGPSTDGSDDFEMSQEELAGQAGRQVSEDPLEELAPGMGLPKDEPEEPEAKPAKPAKPKDERGLITALVKELLMTTMPYAAIVERVTRRFPGASTTARSVASVASDMRKRGERVPERRVPAGSK